MSLCRPSVANGEGVGRRAVAAKATMFAAACALIVLLPGCAQKSDVKILRMAYVSGPTELLHTAAKRFAEDVSKRTGGRVRVKLYPGGQLGDDRETIEGLKLGSIDMTATGCAFIGWYAPEYGLVEAPFLWRDYGHIDRVWHGEIGRELRETIRRRAGVEMLYLWYRGPRYLTTTSRIIHTPADLHGLKLRVPELEVYIKSWQTFGANTTPLPFTDMFMALKLGVVEGQENPLATIYGNHLQEVQKYIMETRHLIGFYVFCVGPLFEQRFTPEERKAILGAAAEATAWHNREVARCEVEYREKLIADGVEFVPVDREAFVKLAKEKIPAEFENVWKPGLYRRIQETP